jgi:hypothetical protein
MADEGGDVEIDQFVIAVDVQLIQPGWLLISNTDKNFQKIRPWFLGRADEQ